MKNILISIKPEWVEKILNGEKTIEIRKTMPKCELPCKVYIYCTKSQKKLLTIFRKGDLIWSDDKDEQRFDKTIFVKDDYFSIADERHRLLGKVVAEFTLNKVEQFSVGSLRNDDIEKLACLSYKEMIDYFYKPEELDGRHSKQGYAWHIENLIIYDKPKTLSEFNLTIPPQSWCYVEEKGDRQ